MPCCSVDVVQQLLRLHLIPGTVAPLVCPRINLCINCMKEEEDAAADLASVDRSLLNALHRIRTSLPTQGDRRYHTVVKTCV